MLKLNEHHIPCGAIKQKKLPPLRQLVIKIKDAHK